ncbi:MAG: hypothetical protein K6U87_02465 [Firmicutes bacterium]|nr:hypothetical protein [Bacillota bacterium]
MSETVSKDVASGRERVLTLRQRLRRAVAWLSLSGFITFVVLVVNHPVGTQAASTPSVPTNSTPDLGVSQSLPEGGDFFNGANQYQVQVPPVTQPPMVMSRVS